MPRPRRVEEATSEDLRDAVMDEFAPQVLPEALQPKGMYRVSREDFVKETRSYPCEVFRGPYYRVIHSADVHYNSLLDGWSDERATDHPYTPETASPEAIQAAKAQIEAAAAKKQAEQAKKNGATVSMDQVQAMIDAALQADRATR